MKNKEESDWFFINVDNPCCGIIFNDDSDPFALLYKKLEEQSIGTEDTDLEEIK